MNDQLDLLGAKLTELIVEYKNLEETLNAVREENGSLKSRVSDLENELGIKSRQLQQAENDIESKNESANSLLKQIENILGKTITNTKKRRYERDCFDTLRRCFKELQNQL